MTTVAVIGCGSIGTRHVSNLLDLGIDVVAFDTNPSRRKAVGDEFGIPVSNSLDHLWETNPDAAVVAVPNSLHIPIAREAADAGCHLFIEKPLSHTLEGVDELIAVIDEGSLITLVGCNMRFHPALGRIEDLIDEGTIGKVVAARIEGGSYLPQWHPDEDYRESYSARGELGGGVILDYIHEIDYARWLFGDVSRVSCFADRLSGLEIDTEDVAAILMRFANGAIGELHVDYVQRDYHRACEVIGENGTIRWSWGEGIRWYPAADGEWRTDHIAESWETNDMYIDEMRHFIECVETGHETICDVREGLAALEIAVAAKRSTKVGRHVKL